MGNKGKIKLPWTEPVFSECLCWLARGRESHLSSGLAGMFVFNINKRFQLYGCYQTGPNTRKPLDFCIRANHHRQKEQRASVLASTLPHVLPPWPSHQMVGRRKAVFHLASRAGRNSSVTAELCSSREQGAGQSQGPTQSCRGCSIPCAGFQPAPQEQSQQQW